MTVAEDHSVKLPTNGEAADSHCRLVDMDEEISENHNIVSGNDELTGNGLELASAYKSSVNHWEIVDNVSNEIHGRSVGQESESVLTHEDSVGNHLETGDTKGVPAENLEKDVVDDTSSEIHSEIVAVDDGLSEKDSGFPTCVVLGGRGFVGKALVEKLLSTGEWAVRIADTVRELVLVKNEENSVLSRALASGTASYFRVDVGDVSQLLKAFEGSSVVFHTDALAPSNNGFLFQYKHIIQGIKNVISASRKCRVKRLIYNSSADVIFDGIHDIYNADERFPHPSRFEEVSCELKAQAESLVLSANGIGGLVTCALRPSNLFGPGDPYLLPLILNEAKLGRSKFIVGDGENMWDFTYIGNCVHALICAERALRCETDHVAGKAFFITNADPMKLWKFISLVLEGLGYDRPSVHLPVKPVLLMTSLSEYFGGVLAKYRSESSYPSASAVRRLSCYRTFDCSKAKMVLGYSPVVTMEEGITSVIESCSHLESDMPHLLDRGFFEPSKPYKLLGSGEVADIILWRDEQKTFICALASFFIFHWFLLSERTLISSAAKLFQLVFIGLFIHGYFPSSVLGITLPKVPSSCFEVSSTSIQPLFVFLASNWNSGFHLLRIMAQGNELITLIKVMISLYVLKVLLSASFTSLVGAGLVFMFTAFYVYEQMEKDIDDSVLSVASFLVRTLPDCVGKYTDKFICSHKKSLSEDSVTVFQFRDHRG